MVFVGAIEDAVELGIVKGGVELGGERSFRFGELFARG